MIGPAEIADMMAEYDEAAATTAGLGEPAGQSWPVMIPVTSAQEGSAGPVAPVLDRAALAREMMTLWSNICLNPASAASPR